MTPQIEIDGSQDFNPFSMMIAPEVIMQRVERSRELASLRKRVLRPLDRPWILQTAGKKMSSAAAKAMAAADAQIEKEFGLAH